MASIADLAEPHDEPTAPRKVDETEIGEQDPIFTYATLGVLAVGALIILLLAWHTVADISLASVNATGERAPYGTWSERVASIVSIMALAIGGVVILVGAWLGALETRGRLRARKKLVEVSTRSTSPITGDDLSDLADVLDKASRLRGSIAVIVAGTIIVLCALWSATSVAANPAPPATTPSPAVSVTPSAVPTPAR